MQNKIAYILFLDAINDKSIQQLFYIIANDIPRETETVYIAMCTEGGSVSHGIAAYNLLKALPYEIIIHNISNMDSIGNLVLMAGKKRYATSQAVFLIHHVSTTFKPSDKVSSSDLQEKLSSVKEDEERINSILKAHTHLKEKDIKELYKVGQSKDAGYALEKNIIHEIKEMVFPKGYKLFVVKEN